MICKFQTCKPNSFLLQTEGYRLCVLLCILFGREKYLLVFVSLLSKTQQILIVILVNQSFKVYMSALILVNKTTFTFCLNTKNIYMPFTDIWLHFQNHFTYDNVKNTINICCIKSRGMESNTTL